MTNHEPRIIYPSQVRLLCEEAYNHFSRVFGDGSRRWEQLAEAQQHFIVGIANYVAQEALKGQIPPLPERPYEASVELIAKHVLVMREQFAPEHKEGEQHVHQDGR